MRKSKSIINYERLIDSEEEFYMQRTGVTPLRYKNYFKMKFLNSKILDDDREFIMINPGGWTESVKKNAKKVVKEISEEGNFIPITKVRYRKIHTKRHG